MEAMLNTKQRALRAQPVREIAARNEYSAPSRLSMPLRNPTE